MSTGEQAAPTTIPYSVTMDGIVAFNVFTTGTDARPASSL
jgi:hypothetical protein